MCFSSLGSTNTLCWHGCRIDTRMEGHKTWWKLNNGGAWQLQSVPKLLFKEDFAPWTYPYVPAGATSTTPSELHLSWDWGGYCWIQDWHGMKTGWITWSSCWRHTGYLRCNGHPCCHGNQQIGVLIARNYHCRPQMIFILKVPITLTHKFLTICIEYNLCANQIQLCCIWNVSCWKLQSSISTTNRRHIPKNLTLTHCRSITIQEIPKFLCLNKFPNICGIGDEIITVVGNTNRRTRVSNQG